MLADAAGSGTEPRRRGVVLRAVFVALITFAATSSHAPADAPGYQFLRIGTKGMSGGFGYRPVSELEYPGRASANPASMAFLTAPSLAAYYTKWLHDVRVGEVSLAWPLRAWAVGLAGQHVGMGKWQNTPDLPEIGAYGQSLRMGLARRFGPRIGIGASVTLFRQSIDWYEGRGYALGLGLLWLASDRLVLGASVRDVGPNVAMASDGQEEPLPTALQVGASYRYGNFTLGLESRSCRDASSYGYASLRYDPFRMVSLMAGQTIGGGEQDAFRETDFGVVLGLPGTWALEYGYLPGSIGDVHLMGLSGTLGGSGGESCAPIPEANYTAHPLTNNDIAELAIVEAIRNGLRAQDLPTDRELPIKLEQRQTHPASWLVQSKMAAHLNELGYGVTFAEIQPPSPVRSGEEGGGAGEASTQESSGTPPRAQGRPTLEQVTSGETKGLPSEDLQKAAPAAPPREEAASNLTKMSFRVVEVSVRYPTSWRNRWIGERRVQRLVRAKILFRIEQPDGVITWSGQGEYVHSDAVSASMLKTLEGDSYAFLSPKLEGTNWRRFVEPVIVTGVVSALVYLFYSNKTEN